MLRPTLVITVSNPRHPLGADESRHSNAGFLTEKLKAEKLVVS